jgi:hypothetical protein
VTEYDEHRTGEPIAQSKRGAVRIREVRTTTTPASCELVCALVFGEIAAGMTLAIRLNASTTVTVPITAVARGPGSDQVTLWLKCDGGAHVEVLAALDLVGDEADCVE